MDRPTSQKRSSSMGRRTGLCSWNALTFQFENRLSTACQSRGWRRNNARAVPVNHHVLLCGCILSIGIHRLVQIEMLLISGFRGKVGAMAIEYALGVERVLRMLFSLNCTRRYVVISELVRKARASVRYHHSPCPASVFAFWWLARITQHSFNVSTY